MKKLINWLSFLGLSLNKVADSFKSLIPAWESLQKANKDDKLAAPEVANP